MQNKNDSERQIKIHLIAEVFSLCIILKILTKILKNHCIFLANQKSGNNEGGEILSSFRRLLNPAQVIDLSEDDPESALEWCHLLGDVQYSILVAGGDGSIAWILDTIHKLNLKVNK